MLKGKADDFNYVLKVFESEKVKDIVECVKKREKTLENGEEGLDKPEKTLIIQVIVDCDA